MKKTILTLCLTLLCILALCGCNKDDKISKMAWANAFGSLKTCTIQYYGFRDNQAITQDNLMKDSNIIHINSIHYLYNTQDNQLYYYTDTDLTNQLVTDDVYNLASLFDVIFYYNDYTQYTYSAKNNYYTYTVGYLVITIKFNESKAISSIELNHLQDGSTAYNLDYDRFTFSYTK